MNSLDEWRAAYIKSLVALSVPVPIANSMGSDVEVEFSWLPEAAAAEDVEDIMLCFRCRFINPGYLEENTDTGRYSVDCTLAGTRHIELVLADPYDRVWTIMKCDKFTARGNRINSLKGWGR